MRTAVREIETADVLFDGYGTIRELAGVMTGLPQLGLAWVEVDAGALSPLHYHLKMSELYFVVEGRGEMWLDGEAFPVVAGQSVSIVPGVVHAIGNPGPGPLRFLVATSPSYDPDDDILVDVGP